MKTYLNVETSNTVSLLICLLLSSLVCIAQTGIEDETCNRDAVDKSIAKLLPVGICIPTGFTVEQVVRDFDFNGDGKYDVAVKYVKYPLQDGNMRYYSVFEQINDSTFQVKKQLTNLAVPFITALSDSYRNMHPSVDSLLMIYPADVRLFFKHDTLKIEHLVPDMYHKTYSFKYDIQRDNWFLQKIDYWIGELPVWLVRNGDLREELLTERIYLEKKKPEKHISIDEFDLLESKRIGDSEESTYFMNKYDIFEIGAKDRK